MLRVESNVLHNGKPVNEPSPNEAISINLSSILILFLNVDLGAVSDLGFKVVNLDENDGEDLSLLKAKHPRDRTESIDIRPSLNFLSNFFCNFLI